MPLRNDGGIPIPVNPLPSGSDDIPVDVGADVEPPKELPILRVEQIEDAWCYAACTKMVIDFLHPLRTVERCDIASFVKSTVAEPVNCCPASNDERCTESGCTVDDFGHIFDRWDVVFSGNGVPPRPLGVVLLSELQFEFDNQRPVLVRVKWTGTGAHALLVTGVDDTKVHVIDSLDEDVYGGWWSYGELVQGFGEGSWTETWLGLKQR